jgi:solute carrier family 25 S-adenosylmethionine transporter 26
MVYERSMQGLQDRACCGAPLIASAAGELAACTIRVPVDMMKQKLQMGYVPNFTLAARGLFTTSPTLLLASFRATAMRDILHTGLQMYLYESFKLLVAKRRAYRSAEELPVFQAAICGSMAGAVSAFITTPVDVLRTRVNLRSSGIVAINPGDVAKEPLAWKSLFADEVRHTYRAKGVAGFFAGAGLRSASMGAGGFLFLGTFELAKSHLSARV